jgi:hypothetical protein
VNIRSEAAVWADCPAPEARRDPIGRLNEAIHSATKTSVTKRVIRWVPWSLGLKLIPFMTARQNVLKIQTVLLPLII